jgi:flagellin
MPVINTNINSIVSQNATNRSDRAMTNTMEKLSTGYRINKSGDDAAGLAVSTKMTAQVRGTYQAARNISDAVAMVQTADGALREVSAVMQRMRELAVQGATETYSPDDLALMDTEYQQLEAEITRIVDQTKWNKMDLLNGAGPGNSLGQGGVFTVQLGADNGQTLDVTIGNLQITSTEGSDLLSDLEGLAVSSQASAAAAITSIDNAFTDLADKRADLGAYMNRLGHALGNAETFAANMSDSNSRIVDTDYAKEMTEFARAQIVRQAGMAMLSQANAIPSQVLQILQ